MIRSYQVEQKIWQADTRCAGWVAGTQRSIRNTETDDFEVLDTFLRCSALLLVRFDAWQIEEGYYKLSTGISDADVPHGFEAGRLSECWQYMYVYAKSFRECDTSS